MESNFIKENNYLTESVEQKKQQDTQSDSDIPENIENIVSKIILHSDYNELIKDIYQYLLNEERQIKKKYYFEMISLIENYKELITKDNDNDNISLESIEKLILIIKNFTKIIFHPKQFNFEQSSDEKDLSKYFKVPKSLLHIM